MPAPRSALQISLRDKNGAEKQMIQRSAPVWCLEWNPSREENPSLLAVGCWDQTLSFYDATGHQHGRDKQLGHDPCSLNFFSNGEYLCVGGGPQGHAVDKEGVRLNTIAESEEWVWSCAPRPNANFVAVGCNDGTITMHQLVFSTVHGLYRERYAFRKDMTDVVVQNMVTEQKMRIKCRAYVKKIAIYKDRLAVQLPDRLYIYEVSVDENMEIRHHLIERLPLEVECNLLVVTSSISCSALTRSSALHVRAVRVREWVMESTIRTSSPWGAEWREGLIVGCEDGTVSRFHRQPVHRAHGQALGAGALLDLSMERDKVAVVDGTTRSRVRRRDGR